MEVLKMYSGCRFQKLGEDREVEGQIAVLRGMDPSDEKKILLFGCQGGGQLKLVTRAFIDGRYVDVRNMRYTKKSGVIFKEA